MNAATDTAVRDFFDWQDRLAQRVRPLDEARVHGQLITRLQALLRERLRGLPARVWAPGPAVHLAEGARTVHPDLAVSSDEADLCSGLPLHAPSLLIEVATAATAGADRGEGFEQARTLPTLREYVVVEAGRARVDVYRRRADGGWLLDSHGAGEGFVLAAIDGTIEVDALYEGARLR